MADEQTDEQTGSRPTGGSREGTDSARDKELGFCEEVGLAFEAFGMPRMSGRIWAMLMIAPEQNLSSGELARALGASSGSISSMTRLLTQVGYARRVRHPGDRSDYFEFSSGTSPQALQAWLSMLTSFTSLCDQGLELFGDRAEARARLEETRDFHAWFERESRAMFERWTQARGYPSSADPSSATKESAR